MKVPTISECMVSIAAIAMLLGALFAVVGCDEGLDMAGDIITPEPEYGVTQAYTNGVATAEILPPSAWVLDFPGPYREYAPPESGPEDFVGRVAMPVAVEGVDADNWAEAHFIAPVSNAIVTITHGPRSGEQVLTGEGGYYLFEDVEDDELYLRVERQWLEPKEVIVHRTHRTELQHIESNRIFNPLSDDDSHLGPNTSYSEVLLGQLMARNSPGMILMGLRWPSAVRFILESEVLPHDVLCTRGIPHRGVAGTYSPSMVVTLYNKPEDRGRISYGTLIHELAHARQHAAAIQHGMSYLNQFNWRDTPEGRAYKVAWEKDLEETPHENWIGGLDTGDYFGLYLHENAAEFCAMYWALKTGKRAWNYEVTRDGGIQKRAPNRYEWCRQYLNTKYD